MKIEILQKAFDKWGKETQINKLQEEALELALILNQRNCPTKDKDKMEESLYDELADMKIMMVQAEMFLFDADKINQRVEFKLERLKSKYFQDTTQENLKIKGIEVKYSYCGGIPTDINYIKCEKNELEKALKALDDNLSQVGRITLEIGSNVIYIYNDKCSGRKRASKKPLAIRNSEFIDFVLGGTDKIEYYSDLKMQIENLLNN